MFHRVLTVGIVAFWLLMMGTLLRVEFSSAEGERLPVPPKYVWTLMFLHAQPSDLVLYSQHQRIGNFHLQPRRLPNGTDGTGGPVRLLTGTGGFTFSLPGLAVQNVTLRGSLEMDEHHATRRFAMNASMHTSGQSLPGYTLTLDAQPERDLWHYQLRQGETVLQENTGTSAVLLDAVDVRSLGLDPKALMQTAQQQTASATITARRGVLRMNSEDIECFIVSIRHGELLKTTMYVSQLGQILAVQSSGGYDLYDEGFAP